MHYNEDREVNKNQVHASATSTRTKLAFALHVKRTKNEKEINSPHAP